MKKLFGMIGFAMITAAAAAHADTVSLAYIDTNNCAQGMYDAQSLNNPPSAVVSATCNGPGSYPSNNGRTYQYRIVTTVTTQGPLTSGTTIQLGSVVTNDCATDLHELSLLNAPRTANIVLSATCSDSGSYTGSDGNVYSNVITTELTIK